jgi:NAD(P)-dependent dehydrogenase (short-subunit alcohol dehydrogenase family)
MQIVAITGSTRGIGLGLTREFLRRGCGAVVSSRDAGRVGEAVERLAAEFAADRVFGEPCDVTNSESVQALWDASVRRFGRVDIWINNAGVSHHQADLAALSPEDIRAVVETNLVGTLYGCRVALNGMRVQGRGAIYNLEGLGSDGRRIRGLHLYGTTKYAVAYLTDALAAETKGSGVIVGAIRPGMVLTELITSQYTGRDKDWRRLKRLFRIISSDVADVVPVLAERVLANRRSGARIVYRNPGKMLRRAVQSLASRDE